ncbi:PfkB family carbohydrate kinase [Halorientalis regularis]|uniref:Ribokinase n=1 Tax=Halorientalis regularis TaxID=660518 RepID=A0A1G7S233_9EURY|nr:PfkB family carbohydrate kinase [Halorientalis regularis]SDG17078.1 ribokinase [Halorientalis regularis]
MVDVVSLGSINVDRIRHLSGTELAALADRYDWFPDRGRTVTVAELPPEFPTGADRIRHGGKGGNQAVAASSAGAATEMLGKVGSSGEADVRGRLADAGVGVDRIETAPDPTGTAYVFVDPDGDNRIVVRPGANGAVDATYVDEQYERIRSAACLLLQNEIPVGPMQRLLTALAAEPDRPTVVFDPAPAGGAEALLDCEAIDYLTPNETEYEALQPDLDAFDGVLVRKRGGDDVVVEADRQFRVTPPSVDAVDTTGAGDVLNGFLAASLAAGASLREAVELGTIAGSLSTRKAGARSGVPTTETVRSYRRHGFDG